MRQSSLFSKTRKEAPRDEVSKNAKLLTRAGFIHKEMAGAYSFLPLGLRVFNNIIRVIREEMHALGGQEIHLTALQDPSAWKKSGRWSDEVVDVWFKTTLKNGSELGLANTHEEPLTALLREYVASYRDLPVYPYQFQTKFRNELRAKSGLLRTREFVMKDLYSFSRNEEEHERFYTAAGEAYERIFKRVGLGDATYKTFASGGSFSKFSHEFQTLCDAGEDLIYVSEDRRIAINKEVNSDEVLRELNLSRDELVEKKAIEVGNIFSLGTKFSEPLELYYVDESGMRQPVIMGSYGIGPARLMGTLVEVLGKEHEMCWPHEVAPFAVHVIELNKDSKDVHAVAEKVYETLSLRGIATLYDDRQMHPGEKFADADLIGIPYRLVVSERNYKDNTIEVIDRVLEHVKLIPIEEVLQLDFATHGHVQRA